MVLYTYLNELKLRLVYFFFTWFINSIVLYLYSWEILEILLNPLNFYGEVHRIVFMSLDEGFFGYIQVYLLISFLLALPSLFLHTFFFIWPGLYLVEAWNILKLFSLTCLLSFTILSFVYFYLVPTVWYFFSSFEFEIAYNFSLDFEPKFSSYLSFIFSLFIVSIFLIISFFFFIIFLFCNFISVKMLLLNRRYVFFAFLLISTVISPPDVFSQCILTVLLFVLFEITLFVFLITRLKAYSLIG